MFRDVEHQLVPLVCGVAKTKKCVALVECLRMCMTMLATAL